MKLTVHTQWPVATHSVDHTHPRGTKNDNSTNLEFVRRLYGVMHNLCGCVPNVLDLGCSGGGFVESIRSLHVGALAVGIEGSDYSKKEGRAEWARFSDVRLFTADIGKPFLVMWEGPRHDLDQFQHRLVSFNVVTMWEVLEHLDVGELETLVLNVHTHLRSGGLFIVSVNTGSDRWEGREYHVTIRESLWWRRFFEERGFRLREDLYERFHPHWVRGPNTEGPASTCFVFQR